jgi:lipopolysaccharide transport system ATP-binding protein
MSALAIEAQQIGKRYRIGALVERHPTLREALKRTATGMLRASGALLRGQRRPSTNAFWALQDVSFRVGVGDILGVVGGNGAGKSTLLKILSRITRPTVGRARVIGHVGSLLEVGTGFHPELTGRENIFLNGAILGMRRADIDRNLDAIIDFSDIAQFIDTPVKHYSSGMYLRLAFAVAAHLEPEILLIDEVLAVGDVAFQQKCLGKMNEVATSGRTVVFVSHNLLAVESLCTRAIWLQQGQLREDGTPRAVIARYVQSSLSLTTDVVWTREDAPGTDAIRLRRARVRPLVGDDASTITVDTPFLLEFEFWRLDPEWPSAVRYTLYNERDVLVYETNPPAEYTFAPAGPAGSLVRVSCEVPGGILNDGMYRAVVSIGRDRRVEADDLVHLHFLVRDSDTHRAGFLGPWPGVIRPVLQWRATTVASPDSDRP